MPQEHRPSAIESSADRAPCIPVAERIMFTPLTTILRGSDMKNVIALALVVGAVALGACRREEAAPEPMKLGAAPAAEQSAR